jgi:hypothetical protein
MMAVIDVRATDDRMPINVRWIRAAIRQSKAIAMRLIVGIFRIPYRPAHSTDHSLNSTLSILRTDGVFDAFSVFMLDLSFRDYSHTRGSAKSDQMQKVPLAF